MHEVAVAFTEVSHRSQAGSKTKGNATSTSCSTSPTSTACSTQLVVVGDNSTKVHDKKKKSKIPKLFSSKRSCNTSDDENSESEFDRKLTERTMDCSGSSDTSPQMRKNPSEGPASHRIQGLNLSNFEQSMAPSLEFKHLRIFVGTWNVGGRTPCNSLDLEDFLQEEDSSDVYVLGFQEIVRLNAGNVLVNEDTEPAAKWLALINQALNRPCQDNTVCASSSDSSVHGSKSSNDPKSNFFQKPALKAIKKNLKVESSLLKTCNCSLDSGASDRWMPRETEGGGDSSAGQFNCGSSVEEYLFMAYAPTSPSAPYHMKYRLIASKQMVGLFLTVWARNELVPHVGHLRVCTIGRGIMNCLGNKGCISVSMTLHRTSFCFVCSHLAAGEKEGDELKRNSDVTEILKSTHFQNVCKSSNRQAPEKILDHDRVMWLGDLNYRVSLSYEETQSLLKENDWESLLQKDQLNVERKAGRVFNEWKEGRILFAPTYKYSQNSDCYAGETAKSKKKRRTPAWCDRILWHGNGIEQLYYIRGESRFSDHRPVCAAFYVEIEARSKSTRYRKGYSCMGRRSIEYDNFLVPQHHSFHEF
ncbi:hypothetical protein Dimus_017958 [Dionaea muscipula]